MLVDDLLRLRDLSVVSVGGGPDLLMKRVVTVVELSNADSVSAVEPGALVLAAVGEGGDDASHYRCLVAAIGEAGAVGLLVSCVATAVPEGLVEASAAHGIPLLAVSSDVSLRTAADRIHRRLMGELYTEALGSAVPLDVLGELGLLWNSGTALPAMLEKAVDLLGLPACSVLSATGRVVAAGPSGTGGYSGVTTPVGTRGESPFDGWWLVASRPPMVPTALLALANVLAPLADWDRARAAARREAADALLAAVAGRGVEEPEDLLASCGLPPGAPLTAVVARVDVSPAEWSADALTEGLRHLGFPFAAGGDEGGQAVALVAADPQAVADGLGARMSALRSVLGRGQRLRFGVAGAADRSAAALDAAAAKARYVLETADPIGTAAGLRTLATLLRGLPAEVAADFRDRVLGPVLKHDRENAGPLAATLTTFLGEDCSWTRTARSLEVHVNTVRYRVRRIEELTGRDLGRLTDRLDLQAALLCAPAAA